MTMHMMMGNRELRGVPLDFDWPLEKVWQGYQMPDELRLPECEDCEGSGFSPTARWLYASWWPHKVADPQACWRDKLNQADLDFLIDNDYLWRRDPDVKGRSRIDIKLGDVTLEEINAQQREYSRFPEPKIIGIREYPLIKRRCKALGADHCCDTCQGHADIGTLEQRQAVADWKPTEPPTGDGIQVWETTSEGSPITPVFPNTEEGRAALAQWLVDNPKGGENYPYATWLHFVTTREEFCVDLATNQPVFRSGPVDA